MAEVTKTYREAMKEEDLELDGKYLVVSTIEDGYTGTHYGNHAYQVVKEELEYKVYPVFILKNELTRGEYPIILTDEETVFFTVRTTIDPYSFAYSEQEEIVGDKNKAILMAFECFIRDKFNAGGPAPYNNFIIQDFFIWGNDPDELLKAVALETFPDSITAEAKLA